MSNNDKQRILEEYDNKQNLYSTLKQRVESLLHDLLDKEVKIHSITPRIKERESLIKKIETKNKYEALKDITDILGLRIITYFSDDVDKVATIIENEFKIYLLNSIDKRQILDPDRFGYLSLHYVAYLSEDRLKLTENQPYTDCCFEIQIRSLLQHAWAEIEHDIGYKTSGSVPKEIKRRFSRLAGLLELADEEFQQIRTDITHYRNEVESNISKQALERVLIDLNSVQQFLMDDLLIKELSTRIAQTKNVKLYDHFPPEADLIERLKATGFNNLADIKSDLEIYKEQVVNFALAWIRNSYEFGFITPELTLIYLCYIKLSLLPDINQIARSLKEFKLRIDTDQEAIELAQKIVEISRKINKQ
jgi:ppGpp synthetase/RelA/SpoT-type nucleotidyltranferase